MTIHIPIRESAKEIDSNATQSVKFGPGLREDFLFDKDYINLNHGMTVPPFKYKHQTYR
jgi:hypothetical protein